MRTSVIIPFYNEEDSIEDCLKSLIDQSVKTEIIAVDDGSIDRSTELVKNFPVKLLQQKHQGPGLARNLGATEAEGDILVFVDADMTFDRDFIKNLVQPILDKKTIGTFSKEEYVSNKNNVWSRCWNINRRLPIDRMHGNDYPNQQKVFRAILKSEFNKTNGFKPIGYIDDHTMSDQLGVLAQAAPGAIFYHQNPGSLSEVFKQARWIGKSEYKNRKIKNQNLMRIMAIVRYNPIFSLINGLTKSINSKTPQFIIFKIVYDLAIEISLFGSFFGEQQYK